MLNSNWKMSNKLLVILMDLCMGLGCILSTENSRAFKIALQDNNTTEDFKSSQEVVDLVFKALGACNLSQEENEKVLDLVKSVYYKI